ncbi:putative AAA+ ATPase domain, ATPase, AAA-type, core [Helianthus annuus]|nr:putative AAA+ ATPase domain, ATPase, AAA-type, core [Helianthus annuus]KAJ0686408.1 putative AAA+ ATPase domain, ATPase, AAA-type, core [Helianthus annuus]KAJ0690228.1 putative AAA+ ATPase domain, ATPase, AAA-type, core [Helianthus annuus]KAJ0871717.1 putative AAA+ ATPase domain, ATPase, AAA-type, core [Helianthus annuus]
MEMESEDLGWLEADLDLHDDYIDEDFEPPLPEEEASIEQVYEHHQPEPITKPDLSIPDDHIADLETETLQPKKRLLNPSLLDSANINDPLEDKRCRVDLGVNEADDEWMRYSPVREEAADVVEDVTEEKERFISRFATDIDGDFMPVTAPDGDRVYAKLVKEEVEDKVKKLEVKGRFEGLMMEPISVLMQKVEQKELQKALEASVSTQIDTDLLETPVVTEQLWVDKYSPNSFVELLSDEHTNREVLMWLKQWDSSVFGTEVKSTTDDVLSALKRHSSVSQQKKVYSKSNFGRSKEFVPNSGTFGERNHFNKENYDSHAIHELHNKKIKDSGPPEQKILLLCGAPGLGKTTLAHVAARHCGYRVVEINASDDRSSSTIETKILDVVQMNSVMADSRPKCLVIDEIDGALGDGKGAVDVILKMVAADKKSDTGTENNIQSEQSGKTSSKKKRKDTPLLRPVICICNDLYAPALRPLRNVAKVHVFVQPTVNRIVNRLKYICNKEGMRTSSVALTALAEYTECDIRACLNTLQFLNKKKEMLNVLDISSQVIGRKDTSKSVFDIWKEVFQKRRLKGVRKSIDGCRSSFNEFTSLHSLISNCGNYDLILDGIHENILQLNYHDPVMKKTVKCLNNLEISDILHQYLMRTQKMSLLVYQPAIAIAIHGVVSQVEKPNIQWPKSFHRYRMSLIEKVEALHTWHNKISPCISRHISTKSFVADLVSPLLHILSPPTLRPVALHLLSEKEKNEMAQLVRTMVSYAITYRNKKVDPLPGKPRNQASTDTQILSFDPPIGDFVNFEGYICNYFMLASAVKQVLSHEVEKQRILQSSINKSKDENERTNLSGKEKSSKPEHAPENTKTSISNLKNSSAPNRVTSAPANTIVSATASGRSATLSSEISKPSETTKKRSSGSFNFFDRFRKTSANGSQMTETVKKVPATSERDSRPVLFKFNEGFTNAVKRPVRMRDLLM